MPTELVDRLRATPDEKTGMFDTHPADADRLVAARAVGSDGVMSGGDATASALFADFMSLCTTATRHHYEHDLGLEPESLTFVSIEAALNNSGERQVRRQALDTMFDGCISFLCPLSLPPLPALPREDLVVASQAARATMSRFQGEGLQAQYRQLEELESRRIDAISALKLFDASFKSLDAKAFGLQTATRDEAKSLASMIARQQQALAATLQPFDSAAISRLTHGVALAGRGGSGEDLAPVLTAVNAMAAVVPVLVELRQWVNVLEVVEGNLEGAPSVVQAKACVGQIREAIANRLRRVHDSLILITGPDGRSSTAPTLAALCGLSPSTPPEQAEGVIQRAWRLYFDFLGQLTAATLQVEETLASAAAAGVTVK